MATSSVSASVLVPGTSVVATVVQPATEPVLSSATSLSVTSTATASTSAPLVPLSSDSQTGTLNCCYYCGMLHKWCGLGSGFCGEVGPYLN